MAELFYGTSVEQAGKIVENGFTVCSNDILLCPDADTAHLYAWLDAAGDKSYAVVRTYYRGLSQEMPLYRQEESVSVATHNLSRLVVRQCLVFDMASGDPIGIIKKDS